MASLEQVSNFLQQNQHGFDDGILYVDWIELIARKATELTYGQGPIVDSEIPEVQDLLNSWMDKVNFLSILRTAEWQDSAWGKSIIYLTVSMNGEVVPHYLRNIFNGRVAKISEQEQLADIWNQDYQGDSNIFTRVTITATNIRVREYGGDFNEINDVKTEVSQGLKPKKDYSFPNLFKSLPVVEMVNRTYVNWMNQTQVNLNPDWAPVTGLIKLYNNSFLIANKEIVANRTRYFGSLPPNKMNDLRKKAKEMLGINDIMGDAWVNQSFATQYANGQAGASLQVVQGTPALTEYVQWLTELETKIMNGAGYEANQRVNADQYENKTASLFSNKLDEDTTRFKRQDRKPKIYQLLDCVLRFNGVEPFKDNKRIYSLKFIDAGIAQTTQMTDDVIKKLEAGLMTTAEARSILMNEPMSVAKQKVLEAHKESMQQQEEMGELQNKLDGFNDKDEDDSKDNRAIKPEKDTLEGAD